MPSQIPGVAEPIKFRRLSVLIPVYNERYFVSQLIDQVLQATLPTGMERELVIVDDCSTDGTQTILSQIAERYPEVIQLHFQDTNRGKGAALRKAIAHATGDVCIFQDADLEYDPGDYQNLLRPILAGDADVVYGSRYLSSNYRKVHFFWHTFLNRSLTTFSNLFTDLTLTDMETCYKAAKSSILKSIPIRSDRFGVEPEITAKFSKRGCRIFEVPISYRGRSQDEGKKIKWFDGIKAVFAIIYFRFVDDIYEAEYGKSILYNLSRTHRTNAWMAHAVNPWIGERVLEIGAGLGNITLKLLPRLHYTASDREPLQLDYLQSCFGGYNWMDVARLDLEKEEDFDALDEEYDSIVCVNVLQHTEEDEQALMNIFGTLISGGKAVIIVPHGKWLYSQLDRALGYIRRYSRSDLIVKCRRAGFEMERVFSFNRAGLLTWFVIGKILRRKRFGKLTLKFHDSLVWLWRILDKILPLPGVFLVGIAIKPTSPQPRGQHR
ncbi:MAG TPA: glycosyl transferase [Candidatus Latescibacteria bacterium]|nr:glycosyl transferase [Candidatus Latescibacterota bacterium]